MSTPTGRSGSQAIQDVRDNADEPSLPQSTTILRFLNRAIEEVERRLNGIFVWTPYPTVALQTFVALNTDLQYVESLSWSSGATNTSGFITSSSPLSQGSLVYPVRLMEQGSFMDFAAGFPAVGFGPPNKAFIYTDQGTAPGTTLPAPAAPVFAIQAGASTVTSLDTVVTYTSAAGETTPSSNTVQALATSQQGVVLSPQGYSNATGYNVYVKSGGTYWLQNATPVALGVPYTIPSTPLTSGTAAPSSNTATGSGQGGAMFLQLYPAAMIGQLNVYGRMRPQLWADTTANSWTNLDTSMQEAVVLYATILTLRNRSRADDAKDWKTDYEAMIQSLQETALRRTRPQSGIVRDVSGPGLTGAPFWA
jgi:hypothetical protein